MQSSGSDWIDKFAETRNSMGYRSTESNPDVCINRVTTENGNAYYKYMLLYVDDVIHLAKDEQVNMLKLNHVYQLEDFFGSPDRYLGVGRSHDLGILIE